MKARLSTDGGARGNPGPAAYGYVLEADDGTVLAAHSRNRRAGELLASGATVPEIEVALGQTSEALDLVPLLAASMRDRGIRAPATRELARLVESRSRQEAAIDVSEGHSNERVRRRAQLAGSASAA